MDSNARGVNRPAQALPAPERGTNQRFTRHGDFLRSAMSARAPAGSVKKKGSEAIVDISDIKNGDGASVLIIHVAAVSWAITQITRDYAGNP